MGEHLDILLAAALAGAALLWALRLVWRDLIGVRHPPYVSLQRAAATLDSGDAQAALRMFQKASRSATRHGDLAALAAAWHGIARAREVLGDKAGAQGAELTAEDAARQVSARSRTV